MKAAMIAYVVAPLTLAGLAAAWGSPLVWRAGWALLAALATFATGSCFLPEPPVLALGISPWGSPVSLQLAAPANWLLASTLWCAVVVYLAPIWRPKADGPPSPTRPAPLTPPRQAAVGWALLAAVCAALLVDDLVARVVALDLASLLVAASIFLSAPKPDRMIATWHYISLRVGDLAFFLVALWLARNSQTFAIGPALLGAGDLRGGPLALLLMAATLAIWVKLGLAPVSDWARAVTRSASPERALILSAAQPLLGYYLLYRLQPAIGATGVWGRATLMGAALLVMISVIAAQRVNDNPMSRWLTLHSAVGLLAAGLGLARPFLLIFVPVRLAICLCTPTCNAESLYTKIPSTLQAGFERLASAACRTEGTLERLVMLVVSVPDRLAARLQPYHTGRLRLNLLWAVLALLPLSLAMVWALRSAP